MDTHDDPLRLDAPAQYRIRVQGRLGDAWSAHFDDMTITMSGGAGTPATTTFTGNVADQAALYGLLSRIRDLGLPLLLVERIVERATGE